MAQLTREKHAQKISPLFAIIPAALALIAGCTNSPDNGTGAGNPDAVIRPPVSTVHDEELRQILDDADAGRWDEAETRITSLKHKDPTDPTVDRIYHWIYVEAQRVRDRALESELRKIQANSSRFTNSIDDLLLDEKTRGLDLPQSLREALNDVPKSSAIPPTYGHTINRSAPTVGINDRDTPMDAILKNPVTLQLTDATLESIIFNVGKATGINFIADTGLAQLQKKVTVNMTQVPLSDLLDYITRLLDVHFEVGDNLVWIVDGKTAKNLMEETRFYRLSKGFIMPAQHGATDIKETRVTDKDKTTITTNQTVEAFVPDGAPNFPAIETAIQKFFTGSKYMIDYERNIIVASGTRAQLKTLENIIREFDTAVQQVLIEARFITVSEAAFQQLGVNWETNRPLLGRTATDFTNIATSVGVGLEKTFTGILGDRGDSLTATLAAIEQTGEAQTLSSPRLTVLNNRPASIRDGKTQYYYQEYTTSQTILDYRSTSTLVPKGTPTKLQAGVALDVLASIGGDGRSIMLALSPKVSQDVELVTFATVTDLDSSGRVVSTFDIKLPQSRDQEISTRVVIQSGETVVMGGVIENIQSTFTESVPILSSIPYIGALFRTKTEISKPRYLLIFVTATLLSETGEFIRYNTLEDPARTARRLNRRPINAPEILPENTRTDDGKMTPAPEVAPSAKEMPPPAEYGTNWQPVAPPPMAPPPANPAPAPEAAPAAAEKVTPPPPAPEPQPAPAPEPAK